MSVYKESEIGVQNAIESILNQTFKEFEFIIVLDDPNNVRAKNLLLKYQEKDPRINLIIHDKNLGLAVGLNEAIKISRSEVIARQDTEDISLPNRLEIQYNYLQKNQQVHIIGSALDYVDQDGKLLLKRIYKPIVGKEIKKNNPLGHPSLLIRKQAFYSFGFYKDMYCEDYDLWINWYLKGAVMHNLSISLVKYVQEHSSKISKTKHELEVTIECKEKYTKALNFGVGDYLYLYLQKLVVLLPAAAIVRLFYFHNRLGSKK